MRVLARLAGFRTERLVPVKASTSSLLLSVLLPLIVPASLFAGWRSMNRAGEVPRERRRAVYGELLRLNLHPTVLFGKHLFVEFKKTNEPDGLVTLASFD